MSPEDKMLKVFRPMAIKLDGIWQPASGVYMNLSYPYKAKIILNGREFIADENHFMNLDGYTDKDIQTQIISGNIASLPKAKKKKMPTFVSVNRQPSYRPLEEMLDDYHRSILIQDGVNPILNNVPPSAE